MKISMDKTYQTRNGLPVRLYATDAGGRYPIQGAIPVAVGWNLSVWTEGGNYSRDTPHDLDLVEVKPRHNLTIWLNVYPTYARGPLAVAQPAYSRAEADTDPNPARVACVKVDLDFEEGEGL